MRHWWKDSVFVFSVWSRCKWAMFCFHNFFGGELNCDVDNCYQSCPEICELMAASTLRLLGRFLKHDLVAAGRKPMKTSASVVSESRRPGNIQKSSFIWHCMRTAGCAALMEAVVRNSGAHDRDNRQGGEEGPEKCKDKKTEEKETNTNSE